MQKTICPHCNHEIELHIPTENNILSPEKRKLSKNLLSLINRKYKINLRKSKESSNNKSDIRIIISKYLSSLDFTTCEIGFVLGKDRTTINYYLEQFSARNLYDKNFKQLNNDIISIIQKSNNHEKIKSN